METRKRRKIAESDDSTTKEEYGLLVLYLSGEDDYGAQHAKDYGIKRIIEEVLDGKEPDKDEDFCVETRLYVFESEQDRTIAIRFHCDTVSHIGDYDSLKHTDVHYHMLTQTQLVKYQRQCK